MFTPRQKSQLTDAITRSGMDLSYFEFTSTDTELRLTYLPEKFYFRVTTLHLNSFADKPIIALIVHYKPEYSGFMPSFNTEISQRTLEWSEIFTIESGWLAWIRREFYEQTEHGQAELEADREMDEIIAHTPMSRPEIS